MTRNSPLSSRSESPKSRKKKKRRKENQPTDISKSYSADAESALSINRKFIDFVADIEETDIEEMNTSITIKKRTYTFTLTKFETGLWKSIVVITSLLAMVTISLIALLFQEMLQSPFIDAVKSLTALWFIISLGLSVKVALDRRNYSA